MLEVRSYPRVSQDAPTELLPVLRDPTELLPVLGDPMGDVRRSGEYKVSPETEALMKSVREAAVAETNRDNTIQNLTKEVKECAVGLERIAGECTESNKILTRIETTQVDHAKQLASIWDEKKSKNSAWHSMMPTIVGSIISAVLLAALAMSGVFTPKETPAPPAPKTVPAP